MATLPVNPAALVTLQTSKLSLNSVGASGNLVNRIIAQSKGTQQAQVMQMIGQMGGSHQDQINLILNNMRAIQTDLQTLLGLIPNTLIIGGDGYVSIVDPLLVQVGWLGVQEDLAIAITATSNGNPDIVTIPTSTYIVGDTILIRGAGGDTNINGERIVAANPTTGQYTFTDLAGTTIAGNGSYTGGGKATRYYAGGWFQTLAIGGTGFGDASIRAYANGNVTLNNVTITNTQNGLTTIIGNSETQSGINVSVESIEPASGAYSVMVPSGFVCYSSSSLLNAVFAELAAGPTGGVLNIKNAFAGDATLTATSLSIGGTQVVITQQPAITYTTGSAGSAYTSVEQGIINDLIITTTQTINRLIAHGLVA